MANLRNLKSFISEHEEKLDRKIAAAATEGREGATHRFPSLHNFSDTLTPVHYRKILGAQFTSKSQHTKTWPMRYEMTPRN